MNLPIFLDFKWKLLFVNKYLDPIYATTNFGVRVLSSSMLMAGCAPDLKTFIVQQLSVRRVVANLDNLVLGSTH